MVDFSVYAQSIEPARFNKLKNNIKASVQEYIYHYFATKPMFEQKNITIYFYDDYELQTSVSDQSAIHMYVAVDQPKNYKPENVRKNNKESIQEAYLTLEQMKDELQDIFLHAFGADILVGQDAFSILIKTLELTDGRPLNLPIIVTPCFAYTNSQGVTGVKYYNNKLKNVLIEYPQLSLENFRKKNKETKDNFRQMVTIFKTLYKGRKKITSVSFEPFEMLLYAVPNHLYLGGTSSADVARILNYIRNLTLSEVRTMDGQNTAFMGEGRPFLYMYIRKAVKMVEKEFKSLK